MELTETAPSPDPAELFLSQERGVLRETYRLPSLPESENALRMYCCGSEFCTPGHSFGPAVRPHYLIHFIREGKGIYQRSNQVYHLSRGDAFLILPGETTKYIADSKEPWAYTWIAFDGTQAEALLNCCGLLTGSPVYHSPDESARIRLIALTDQFHQCFQDETKNVLELTGNFYLLFSCLIPSQPENEFSHSSQKQYFQQAVSYLQNNFSYPVRIQQLARQIGVSRSYLYKIFLACSGKSVQQYLQDLRLKEACRLLADTSQEVTDIAYSCGFPDSPAFCRIFRRVYGETPLNFRQRMGRKNRSFTEPRPQKSDPARKDRS